MEKNGEMKRGKTVNVGSSCGRRLGASDTLKSRQARAGSLQVQPGLTIESSDPGGRLYLGSI